MMIIWLVVVTSYTGSRLLRPLRLQPHFRFHPICLAKCIFYISPSYLEKNSGSKFYFRYRLLLLGGIAAVLGLRCSCQDWSPHAKIEVLKPRLRCSCWDWGATLLLNLSMSTSISAWTPQSQHSSYPPKSNSLFWGGWNKISDQSFSSS